MFRDDGLREVAKLLVNAARTAPKTKGQDYLDIVVIEGEEVTALGNEMIRRTWERDGKNVLASPYVLLIGTSDEPAGLNCGGCGFDSCATYEKHKRAYRGDYEGPVCIYRLIDLGIALGSAAKMASMLNVDNRIMKSAGVAGLSLKFVKGNVAFGIPLSATKKSIYFDRK